MTSLVIRAAVLVRSSIQIHSLMFEQRGGVSSAWPGFIIELNGV